jgi:hypothetical protein
VWLDHPADTIRRDPMTLHGVLIGESIRVGAVLEGVPLTVTRVERVVAGAAEQPPVWTIVSFEAADASVDQLAEKLAAVIEPRHGWYCDFHSDSEVIVVFAQRIFRYFRGDGVARKRVVEYARSLGVPEAQLDWAE